MSTRTTPDILRKWFDEGVRKKATHMVVVCDTFDHNDYPVYVMPGQDAREIAKDHDDEKKMSRVMEVYDLRADRDEQLAIFRVMNFGDSKPGPSPESQSMKPLLAAERLRDYSPPVPPTAESKDDGIVDVLNASEQLVAGVRRFAAMVVECQKNIRTKVGDLEGHGPESRAFDGTGVSTKVDEAARLAERLWDTFRALNFFQGVCQKTYGQLGIPTQNVWLAVAARAYSEIRSVMRDKLGTSATENKRRR